MNLAGRPTNPGDLRTSITLQSRTVATDAGGFQTVTYADIAIVLSKWENVHGTEAWQTSTIGAEMAATVTIRYNASVDTTCYVLKGADRYEIVSMDDIRDRHEYMELKVKRLVGG
jgi:SPP1 family predicted phage head-tail adaptor